MKHKIIIICIIALIVGLILIRIFSGSGKKSVESTVIQNPAIPVEVFVAADTSLVYQFSTVGSLRANEDVDIVSEISRKVTSVLLKEGSFVTKGQLLFKLDDADLSARMKKLVVEERLARTNESRQKVQLEKGGISQEKYDETLNHLEILQSEIEILKVDLLKTEIRAPFAGKIGLRNVSEGALVHPDMVLVRLQDAGRIKIDFSVPERYANDLRPGGKVTFTTDYGNEDRSATIEAIEPDVDNTTRTISLRAVCTNADGSLVPGTSARLAIDLRSLDKKLFIPTSALIPSMKGYNLFLLKSGKASLQPVKTGIRNRQSVQITEGLAVGDTIVITNLLRIKPDSPLRVVKFN